MRLADLEKYNPITIQCHDNPDADALGSGYGLYCYFKSLGKAVKLVYSGRSEISKTNLKLMIETLNIPIAYISPEKRRPIEGLLLTVDCQYGAGNVTALEAEQVAIIDHHPVEIGDVELSRIQPNLGSCATLVWNMLEEADYHIGEDENIGTALYYGLYMDTNQFAELFNPLDMDMCEAVKVNKSLMTRYRNANISLQELEIAGIAMLRYDYNDDYRFAVIRSHPCDANLLGLISDFLLQVAEVDACLVFNEIDGGYKLSVRSCVKEVKANELAAFLTKEIGSGGGHLEKAGGFVSKKLYEKKYPTLHAEAYFNNRMTEYFDSFEIIRARDAEPDLEEFELYRRRKVPQCYVCLSDIFPVGTRIAVRSSMENTELMVEEGTCISLERDGNVHSMSGDIFEKFLEKTKQTVPKDYYSNMEYVPVIRNISDGKTYLLSDLVKVAMPKDSFRFYMKKLDKSVKLFHKWNDEQYVSGDIGDYLAVSEDDLQHIIIEPGNGFEERFEKISESGTKS